MKKWQGWMMFLSAWVICFVFMYDFFDDSPDCPDPVVDTVYVDTLELRFDTGWQPIEDITISIDTMPTFIPCPHPLGTPCTCKKEWTF